MRIILTLSTLVFILTSCTSHSGLVLEQGPKWQGDRIIKNTAIGYSSTSYFLGINDDGRNSIISDAKAQLYNCKLKENEVFENLTMDIKTTSFLFYFQKEVFITADIVEYPNSNLYSKYENPLNKNKFYHPKVYVISTAELDPNFYINRQYYNSINNNIFTHFNSRLIILGSKLIRTGYEYPGERIFVIENGEIIKEDSGPDSPNIIFYTSLLINETQEEVEVKVIYLTENEQSIEYKILGVGRNLVLLRDSLNNLKVFPRASVNL